jgi:isoleucyl-tRNA synthetase
MFEPLATEFNFPEAERKVLEFWDRHRVFQRSLEIRAGAPRFVFYEGPPTANGLPHPGHCLTRAMKDLFPRYKTMCGYLVERKAGWDTHGLPVEIEVCKELGIQSKPEIEAYGVDRFVQRCIESVFRYVREWEQMTRRLGFWVNLEDAYVTYHQSYIESVWWSLKTLFDRGLLYQGHKVVWWWAQGGTALSAGEVGEGYRTVEDPAVYVRFPVVRSGDRRWPHSSLPADARVSLLVWTTTPWTLISNHFAAVGPEIDYSLVRDPATGEYLYIATALVETTGQKVGRKFQVVGRCRGMDLVGLRYVPPFDCYYRGLGEQKAALKGGGTDYLGWRVAPADFVTLDAGTGIVHEAPAYGEVDFELLQAERQRFADPQAVPLLNAVAPDGTFTDEAPARYRGRWVKDCDEEIMQELAGRGLLFHRELYRHEYPFCPRAEDDPLIQYARKSWFVRTSAFKEQFLRNNAAIRWLPEHIRDGRFGDFLRNNVDWALSRERYWGTPLPIWVCEKTGKMEAIGSFAELTSKPGATDGGFWEQARRRNPGLSEHLRVHKPYIDAWTYDSPFVAGMFEEDPRTGQRVPVKARMRRVPEVIDCWWDAGSMPFAQWGFPHVPGSVQLFHERFPCDFISEAIDQTRGWFYGLLAISTLLFDKQLTRDSSGLLPVRDYPHPYRTCIVLGHLMGEDGNKMSKRLRNYREPEYIFDHYGADAMRWYFFSAQTPWTSVRFLEANIRAAQREFLLRLHNVLSFFTIYAALDGFEVRPQATAGGDVFATLRGTGWRPPAQRCELDRWILSELAQTIRFVREKMDAFENYPAAGRMNEFVDGLSNWYVRRSRPRFWRPVGPTTGAAPIQTPTDNQDKWDAYNTLYEVLLTLARLLAPFTPFFAETMYQCLVRGGLKAFDLDEVALQQHPAPISVHLCDYPVADPALIDEELMRQMELVREIVSLGRSARAEARLKVRQPLACAEIVLAQAAHAAALSRHVDLIAEELNIKRVEFAAEARQYVTYRLKPQFQIIGPRFGSLAPRIAAALAGLDAAEARRQLTETGTLVVEVDGQKVHLGSEDVQVRLEARPGWSAAQGRVGVVVVSTELTEELKQEGLMREFIHQVQALRKEHQLPYEARIRLYVDGPPELLNVVRRFEEVIRRECLVVEIELGRRPAGRVSRRQIDFCEADLLIERV